MRRASEQSADAGPADAMPDGMAGDGVVLVVDLDGTVIRSDLLYESFWAAMSAGISSAVAAFAALFRGRAALKAALAARAEIDPGTLPYNDAVLDFIGDWKRGGGRTALVTASDERLAAEVAAHLGLFDEVQGSDGHTNLKGAVKAAVLTERYGERGYDYVGDSTADLPVWGGARRAITVNAGAALRAGAEARASDALHLGDASAGLRDHLRALRPHQWLKNILVFLPVLAAHEVSPERWGDAVLAFLAFSLVASSVYVLNDLMDLAADRAHPRKRRRPFASGTVPISHGMVMAPALLLGGLAVALLIGSGTFALVLLGYYALTLAYSTYIKRKLVLDICTLAGLYTLRIIAGGVAAGVTLSVWLLAFSIFFFLSLAAMKRQAELVDGAKSGRVEASGRAYRADDMPIVAMIAIAAGYVAVAVMALYINSPAVQALYADPRYLWGVCPILIYWVSRLVIFAHRGRMDDDPIVFALRDRTSLLCGLVVVGAVFLAGVG